MREVFQTVLMLSINASWLMAAVLLLRALLRKAPKGLCYLLWALVGIRLLCPITVESVFSLVPSQETIEESVMPPSYMEPNNIEQNNTILDAPQGMIGENVNPNIDTNLGDVTVDLNENQGNNESAHGSIAGTVLPVVWSVGVLAILLYAILNYVMLRHRVSASVCVNENIWICDEIQSPFILGILQPRIYVPSYIDERQKPYILAHEKEHLRYFDHLWKPLGYLILAVHWFNPLVWISYILMCRDIEYACDERVIRQMNHNEKKKYTESLLLCSSPRHFISACPVAFGEVGIKERIKSIIKYQKPATWLVVIGVLACVIVAICFMTNQGKKETDSGVENTENTEDIGDTKNTEDSEEENEMAEFVFYETTADLNHDGIEDLVQTVLSVEKNRYDKVITYSPLSQMQNCEAVVRVYLGLEEQGEYEETATYVTRPVNHSSASGTYVLTEKDGKDYLLYSNMHEKIDWALYFYEVRCIGENNEMTIVTNNDAQFVRDIFSEDWNDEHGRREDVIPNFKKDITPWIENGIILVSQNQGVDTLFSQEGVETPANVFYDKIWARKNESETEKELEAIVGTAKWKQYLYLNDDRDQSIVSIIENKIAPNREAYFADYNGAKIQRVESCDGQLKGWCGMSTNCDIIYYEAEPFEKIQSVLYKMIEAMILPRMEESDVREYTITDYAIKESPVLQISNHMWLVTYLNGYHKFEGTELVTFDERMKYESELAVDGLLPFERQGGSSVFHYLLMEENGVYRLERLSNMISDVKE